MVAEKPWPEDAPRGARSYRPNLPREERLVNWDKREQIINRGKTIRYNDLYISILLQLDWKLSVTIKRTSGKAAQRNAYKRKIRESFRLCKPSCPHPAAVAVTVLQKPQKIDVAVLRELLETNINSLSR